MSLPNRLAIQGLCNQLEDVVGDQDLNFGYSGIIKKVHFTILGGKHATAHKEFIAALLKYESDKDKDALAAAVDAYMKKTSERP